MTTQYDGDRLRLPGLLLVDPDPVVRTRLVPELEREGWNVWAVADGAAAIATYRAHPDRIDAALVDLQLPGLQGGRVLADLGQLNPALTRCAMSADLTGYTASAFRRMSGTPLFTKPLDAGALSLALFEMVSRTVER